MKPRLDPMNHEPRFRVGRLLSRVRNRMEDTLDQVLAPYDLTAAQYVVLSTLASGRADSAAQVCKELAYNPGAMTRMLDRLEAKGLIRRIHGQADRRTTKLVLTESGQAVFPALLAAVEAVVAGCLDSFQPEELSQFERFLERMLVGFPA